MQNIHIPSDRILRPSEDLGQIGDGHSLRILLQDLFDMAEIFLNLT